MTVEFSVLGAVEVRVNGQLIAVRGARQQAVLAVLLVEANRAVPGEAILDRAWGSGRMPDRPANAVQTQLTLLRRALRPAETATIAWQPAGYRFTVDDQAIDLHRFHSLIRQARATSDDERGIALFERALALWRGEPFASLDLPWFASLRATLTRERHAAQLDLTDARLRCGQHADVLAELTDLAGRHPMDERLGAQLILALYRSGRTSDALGYYQQVRQQLADDLGIDPSPQLQELHQQILAVDPKLANPARATGNSTVAPPKPRQLPAPPRVFTGRAEELAVLDAAVAAAMEQGETMIAAIVGAGGIGKTWLALYWAHQRLDRFPDGQLYVDLRGYSPDAAPMTSEAAVRGFLGSLGADPAFIPADLHGQAALFRSIVAGKRMLIVLDNAVNATQITPLLSGSPSCAVLVTSRDHLTGLVTSTGAQHLVVDVLTDAEARALLVQQLGPDRIAAESAAVAELLARCGGYPLALNIVAGHALTHPQAQLADVADDLASTRLGTLDTGELTANLPAVFSWSYAALTDEQARLFTLLGLAPGPDISSAAAASLDGLSATEAQALLRGLERASLLQQDVTGRWQMHDLIRQYGAAKAHKDRTPDDRESALRRAIDFYLHVCHEC
ncbi:MAG TPA: BTAD domain-containing putative transcriptional regulator [Pseudonocardiaceae bacterium]|jgi:DNA-binding SARP family transcriptional activator|nr:BTAD domain-containing putative transcriptional regulator [Pseudonocardiaceae bacterium]